MWLVIYTLVGVGVSMSVCLTAAGIALNILQPILPRGALSKVYAIAGCVAAVIFAGIFISRLVQDRHLSLENRRRGPRFFVLGFLGGCAFCCLLIGVISALVVIFG
jgi:hypothetical protein